MSEANKQVALKFLHAISEGDAAGQAECMTQDAFTNTMGFAGVSGRRDRETMLATVEAFNDVVPGGFHPRIEQVVAEGDSVVIEWQGNAVLSNGEDYCNNYVFVFRFAGGKIRQLNEYFCTVLADAKILPLLAAKGEELAHGN